MVGQGVLRACLADPGVERVLAIGRGATGQHHPKLREVTLPDVTALASLEGELARYDACFFCLGVSSAGMAEARYAQLTYDLTLSIATTLARIAPGMTFVYVSGAGTDSSEQGRTMWARVKGRTENALLRLPFRAAYMFRPGLIVPEDGIRSRTGWYNAIYVLLTPVMPLLRRLAPNAILTTSQVGRAMLGVARQGYPTPLLEVRDMQRAAAG